MEQKLFGNGQLVYVGGQGGLGVQGTRYGVRDE